MEQVPHIAMYCQEFKAQLEHVVPNHLLPMVVKFLTDSNNQVLQCSLLYNTDNYLSATFTMVTFSFFAMMNQVALVGLVLSL